MFYMMDVIKRLRKLEILIVCLSGFAVFPNDMYRKDVQFLLLFY